MSSDLAAVTRPARRADVPQIHAIYSHYVLHTITDMHHEAPKLESFLTEVETTLSHGMPYIVAIDPKDGDEVLGFIRGYSFRGYKVGYAQTVELAIMCHPDQTKRGIGSALMKAFLAALQDLGKHDQILAFMTVLEDKADDQRVKGFYEKWGFRESGFITDVGTKFGRKCVHLLYRPCP